MSFAERGLTAKAEGRKDPCSINPYVFLSVNFAALRENDFTAETGEAEIRRVAYQPEILCGS